jgi:hypothetical protein
MEHFIHDQKSNTTTNDDIENLIPSVDFTQ